MTIRDRFLPLRVACALAALCIALPAHAAVIYNNFGPSNTFDVSTGIPVGGATSPLGVFTPAMGFTPAHTFTLTQIDVALSYVLTANSVTLILYSDNGGIPGDELMSATVDVVNTLGTCCVVETVLPSVTVTLDEGSLYWIAVAAIDPAAFDLWGQNTTSAVGPLVVDVGAGFLDLGPGPLGAFDVLGDQVPEPITLALCGGGLALMGLLRRVKR